jgi:RNA polymerase sigma factor (sigma-70 family)
MNQVSEGVVRDAAPGLEATTRTERDQIEQGLVRDAKAYLDESAQGMTPSFLLSEAWDHFFCYGSSVIQGCLRARGLSREDRDDCEQEFWVAVVTQLRRSGYESARAGLRTWLSAIARNKSADAFRRRIRRHPLTLNETATSQIPGREADPASVYERQEEKGLLHKALAALSQLASHRSYQVLLLRSIEELDVSEVAVALGLTPEEVRYRHCRAKQELRRLVETSDG